VLITHRRSRAPAEEARVEVIRGVDSRGGTVWQRTGARRQRRAAPAAEMGKGVKQRGQGFPDDGRRDWPSSSGQTTRCRLAVDQPGWHHPPSVAMLRNGFLEGRDPAFGYKAKSQKVAKLPAPQPRDHHLHGRRPATTYQTSPRASPGSWGTARGSSTEPGPMIEIGQVGFSPARGSVTTDDMLPAVGWMAEQSAGDSRCTTAGRRPAGGPQGA